MGLTAMQRLVGHSSATTLRTVASSCSVCQAGSAAAARSGQLRTYALSRYRDGGGRSPSRIGRRPLDRSKPDARPPSDDVSHAVTPSNDRSTDVTPSNASGPPPSEPRKGFLASIDSYTPAEGTYEPVVDLKDVPVAPGDLLNIDDAAATILSQPSLVVVRQLEMMNVFLGFEQANRYRLVNAMGQDVGFLAEQEGGFGSSIQRQIMRGHRPFSCVVMDTQGSVVLRVNRPFSFINSKISISKGEDPPDHTNKIGECQQIWHPYRRKYALFQREYHGDHASSRSTANEATKDLVVSSAGEESYTQFANIDARLLAWDFYLQGEGGQVLGSVNRNFMGFGREIFTDTGQYVLRFDKGVAEQEVQTRLEKGMGLNEEIKKVAEESSAAQTTKDLVPVQDDGKGLTLDQRAVLLAAAVTIDIDYFSRSGGGGMHMPMLWMPLPGGGGGADVPPAGGEVPPGGEVPSDGGSAPSGTDTPIASPEYGDSPGMADYPSSTGFPESGDYGAYGGGDDAPFSDGGEGETMHDPWASAAQQDASEGGGFWGWVSDVSDTFGGDE